MAPDSMLNTSVLALIATLSKQFIPEVKVKSNFEMLVLFAWNFVWTNYQR